MSAQCIQTNIDCTMGCIEEFMIDEVCDNQINGLIYLSGS